MADKTILNTLFKIQCQLNSLKESVKEKLGTNTLVVSTEGSDGIARGDDHMPYKTLLKAAQTSSPGDTIIVMPGTYEIYLDSTVDVESRTLVPHSDITWAFSPGVTINIDGDGGSSLFCNLENGGTWREGSLKILGKPDINVVSGVGDYQGVIQFLSEKEGVLVADLGRCAAVELNNIRVFSVSSKYTDVSVSSTKNNFRNEDLLTYVGMATGAWQNYHIRNMEASDHPTWAQGISTSLGAFDHSNINCKIHVENYTLESTHDQAVGSFLFGQGGQMSNINLHWVFDNFYSTAPITGYLVPYAFNNNGRKPCLFNWNGGRSATRFTDSSLLFEVNNAILDHHLFVLGSEGIILTNSSATFKGNNTKITTTDTAIAISDAGEAWVSLTLESNSRLIFKDFHIVCTNSHCVDIDERNVIDATSFIVFDNCTFETQRAGSSAIETREPNLIFKNCTFITDGVAASINTDLAGPVAIRYYGTNLANVAANAAFVPVVGALTVDAQTV
jgi:hypothetical protein